MASTYTPLGVELQATGENAGTWGTKTNTNLQILEQISGGFTQKSIAGGAQTTALTVSDGSTGAELAHRMIEFTGTITGNQIVTIPFKSFKDFDSVDWSNMKELRFKILETSKIEMGDFNIVEFRGNPNKPTNWVKL